MGEGCGRFTGTLTAVAGILILDDETTNRRLMRGLLERDHHTVWEAATTADLFDVLETQAAPELAIFDLHLQAESGVELLRRLRNDPIYKGLPVLLCSGAPDRSAVVEAAQLGAAGFLAKPIDPVRMRATVTKALGTRWMRTLFDDLGTVCRRLSTDRDKLAEMAKSLFSDLNAAVMIKPESDDERANLLRQIGSLRRTAANLGIDVLEPLLAEWERSGGHSHGQPELLKRVPVLARLFAVYVS